MPDRLAVIRLLEASGVECHTRAEWGSPRESEGAYARRRGTHPMPAGPADYHFLHLTVTSDTDTIPEGAAGARHIEGYGYSSPPMVSYQDLVTNEGRYFQGQDYGTKGTHTVNDKNVSGYPRDLNLAGYACALMQNEGDDVTDIQVDVVARVFAARELSGWVRRGAPILPHRKFAAKRCPGDKAVARLDDIARLKDHYVKNGLQEDYMATNDAAQKLDRIIAQNEAILTAVRDTRATLRRKVEGLHQRVKGGNVQGREIARELEALVAELADDPTTAKETA